MSIQKLQSQDAFDGKVNQLFAAAGDKNQWIHDDMHCSTKNGRFCRFLGTLLRLIGVDVFGHVRVNKVATQMLEFAKTNKEYLNNENAGKLLGILSKLDANTHKKYHKTVENMQLAVKGILMNDIVETNIPTLSISGAIPKAPTPPPIRAKGGPAHGRLGDLNAARNNLKKTPVDPDQESANTKKTPINPDKKAMALDAMKKIGNLKKVDRPKQEPKQYEEVKQVDFRNVLKKRVDPQANGDIEE